MRNCILFIDYYCFIVDGIGNYGLEYLTNYICRYRYIKGIDISSII